MIAEVLLGVTVIVCTIIVWYIQSAKTRSMLAKIPGPPPLPILGNSLELKTDGAGKIIELVLWIIS